MHHPTRSLHPISLVPILAACSAGGEDPECSTHATLLEPAQGEVPEWVQLLPAGSFRGIDGRGPFHNPNAAALVAASNERSGGRPLPIDYDHALECEDHGAPAPASGWITQLEARNGEVWGRVEWTAAARQKIADREYRYLSPVFFHAKDGGLLWLARAGLTNKPNLPLKSLNSTTVSQEKTVSDKLKATLARIAVCFGLPETSDEDAIVSRCSAAVEAETSLGKITQGLSLAATSSADDVVRAVNARTTAAPDPAKFVPIALHSQVAEQLKAAQSRESKRVVDEAIKDGKIAPALREWALAYHAKDPAGFEAMAEKAPVLVGEGAEQRTAARTGRELSADAKSVCTAFGIAETDFQKNC